MEQPLVPFGSCNLSSINVAKFCSNGAFDSQGLYDTARKVAVLMDNVIDCMSFPDPRFKETSLKYRQIGIGMMGLADAMYEMGYKYDSPTGRKFAGEVMACMSTAAVETSAELANERGKFFEYDFFRKDVEEIVSSLITEEPETRTRVLEKVKKYGLRNSQRTTVAPTGTTSLSADASYGMEPCMGLAFQKNVIDGTKMIVVNPVFERKCKGQEWYTDDLVEKILANGGSLKGLRGIPKEVREVFIVAHDIKPRQRIEVQSEIQRFCDSAISSTLNLSEKTTQEEVSEIYKYAYEKGLKGVTIYRDGSKRNQPVSLSASNKEQKTFTRPSRMKADSFRLDTGNGHLYVNVSTDGGKPLEVFLQLGKSGQMLNTFAEALGRVISISLQNGVPVDSLTETLLGINSDRTAWIKLEETDKKPVQILSIPDALAKLLDRFYSGKEFRFTDVGEPCPVCKIGRMVMVEGCSSCLDCGYSKCS